MTRRDAMALLAAVPVAAWAANLPQPAAAVSLGFSLYGMKNIPVIEAIRTCAAIGYDGVELCLFPGWTEPDQLSPAIRRDIRSTLQSSGLVLSALMEDIHPLGTELAQNARPEHIRKAAALGHDLSSSTTRIETVLGGKPTEWESMKHQMADHLAVWAAEAARCDALLCIKAHVGGAVDTPDKLLWLYHQVNLPALKLVYDYSHFQLAGLSLERTLRTIIPYCAFIHVKDAKGDAAQPQFLLPGDGTVDYAVYFRLLHSTSYVGPVVCEVSAQLQKARGYDPLQAARQSYQRLSQALTAAHLPRQRMVA
jgi:sugar phosphate isomerase/epimerase